MEKFRRGCEQLRCVLFLELRFFPAIGKLLHLLILFLDDSMVLFFVLFCFVLVFGFSSVLLGLERMLKNC